MEDLTTQELKDELTRRGYYTKNLWHIDDVQSRYEATDNEAQDVLDEVLQGSSIIERIFEDIFDCADEYKLKEINETI